jgi:serine/threonine-protein phosphatase 4 regulatory subunit 4
MCRQVHALCCAVGPEQTHDVVLPELIELLKDEKHQVRDAALGALANVITILNNDVIKTTIIPVVRELVEATEREGM